MQGNIMILLCILLCIVFTAGVFGQYSFNHNLRPDVTFGEHNDRFDVAHLVDYQNRHFRAGDEVDYRRKHRPAKKIRSDLIAGLNLGDKDSLKLALVSRKGRKKLAKRIQKETEEKINALANEILLRMNSGRRTGENWALHDDMTPGGGDLHDFNENLGKLRAGSSKTADGDQEHSIGYRKVGTDLETFKYAFPIDMNVQGYLVLPVH